MIADSFSILVLSQDSECVAESHSLHQWEVDAAPKHALFASRNKFAWSSFFASCCSIHAVKFMLTQRGINVQAFRRRLLQ